VTACRLCMLHRVTTSNSYDIRVQITSLNHHTSRELTYYHPMFENLHSRNFEWPVCCLYNFAINPTRTVFWKPNANLLSICSLDGQLKVFGQSQLQKWKREHNCTEQLGYWDLQGRPLFRASTVGFVEITRTVVFFFLCVLSGVTGLDQHLDV
jgi:hypothetical protein